MRNQVNWRSIEKVGNPTDPHMTYLVTDGREVGISGINCQTRYGVAAKSTEFISWTGDENTWEDNSCCSGTRMFDMRPTHWCPTSEFILPSNTSNTNA